MILILGCGFLGSYLLREIFEKSDESIVATVRDLNNAYKGTTVEYICCDITKKEELDNLFKRCKNEELTVFYFASCHNVDYVFENPAIAEKINIEALKNFIEGTPNVKKLFFSSTDCVYGEGEHIGTKFSEKDELNPINEYGKQKAMAEKIIIENGFTVLRFPFLIGPSLINKKHFYDKILSDIFLGNTVELIDGMKRAVISYSQAARYMYKLSILDKVPSIINVCGDDVISKYDIGYAIARKNLKDVDLLKKISEKEGMKFFKDKRASVIDMDNTLLKKLLGIEKIQWEEIIC